MKEALIQSTGQIGEQILCLSQCQNCRNPWWISKFWRKTGEKDAARMCPGIYLEVPEAKLPAKGLETIAYKANSRGTLPTAVILQNKCVKDVCNC